MKSKLSSVVVFFLLFSCSPDQEITPFNDSATSMSAVSQLMGFNANGRQYNFYYNGDNLVDSIAVGDPVIYTYIVSYNDQAIESVNLRDGGEIVATNDQFTFDKKGNITSYRYTFFLPDLEEGISQTVDVTYDKRGRISNLTGPITYDNQSNITLWQQGSFSSQYSYEKSINPLYGVENLFVMLVEETYYWDYILSKHNSITKVTNGGTPIEFVNEYDKRKRLVSKTAIQNGTVVDQLTFSY